MSAGGASLGGGAASLPFDLRRRQETQASAAEGRHLDPDPALAAACLLATLAAPYSAWAGAAMAGLAPLYLFLRRRRLARALAPRLFLYLPAFAALCAVVWSTTPSQALAQGLELGLTATAGLLLASAPRREAVIRALAVALAAAVPMTLAFGSQIRLAAGLTEVAAGGLIAAVAALLQCAGGRERLPIAGLVLAALYEAGVLVLHAPRAALLEIALALAPLAVLAPLIGACPRRRALALAAVTLACLGLAFATHDQTQRYVDHILAAGWTPVLVLAGVVLTGAVFLARRYLERPSISAVFWIAMLLFELPRLPIGNLGLAPLSAGALLLFASLAAGFARARPPRIAPRPTAKIISLDEARARWGHARKAPGRGAVRVLRSPEPGA